MSIKIGKKVFIFACSSRGRESITVGSLPASAEAGSWLITFSSVHRKWREVARSRTRLYKFKVCLQWLIHFSKVSPTKGSITFLKVPPTQAHMFKYLGERQFSISTNTKPVLCSDFPNDQGRVMMSWAACLPGGPLPPPLSRSQNYMRQGIKLLDVCQGIFPQHLELISSW